MRRIALQSAVGGMALSVLGMLIAAFGFLVPVAGAVAQEVIDVIAILNSLRTIKSPRRLSDFPPELRGDVMTLPSPQPMSRMASFPFRFFRWGARKLQAQRRCNSEWCTYDRTRCQSSNSRRSERRVHRGDRGEKGFV